MKKVLFILGELGERDIDWMLATGSKEQIPAGTTLIQEGEPIVALYIVLDGLLAVSSKALRDQEIARLGSGEIVGEMSFVDARPPSATVTAIENSVVFSIPRSQLTLKLQQDSDFAARFYRAIAMFLSDRLRGTVVRLGYGGGQPLDEEIEYEDELDLNVLDNVYLAGSRFDQMLKRLMES